MQELSEETRDDARLGGELVDVKIPRRLADKVRTVVDEQVGVRAGPETYRFLWMFARYLQQDPDVTLDTLFE